MISISDEFVQSLQERYGTAISKLNLSNNGLRDVKRLSKLSPSLVKLTLNQNILSDMTDIAALPNLVELHVAENRILDISPLRALTNLEVLDLSGNLIESITQLQALRSMNNLQVCHLKGNPISVSATEYPVEIFRLQPQLTLVDDWTRDDAIQLDDSLRSVLLSQTSANQTRANSVALSASSPQAVITSLQQQLQAMNETFVLQEKALERNGAEAAEYAFGLSPTFYQQQLSMTTASSGKQQSHLNRAIEKEMLAKFPYYRLLQMWRQKTFTILLHDQRLQRQVNDLYRQQQKERTHTQQAHQELECQVVKWKTRTQALDEQVKMLSLQLQDLQQQLTITQTQQSDTHQHIAHYQQLFRQLQVFVMHFQHQHQQQLHQITTASSAAVGALPELQQVSLQQFVNTQCQHYESKLQHLQTQIQRLQEHFAYQQIQHRNALAMVEAEKRLQQLRFAKQVMYKQQSLSTSEATNNHSTNTTTYLAELEGSAVEPEKFLSDLQLSGEFESLLKALFKSLDVSGEGSVSRSLWVQSLLRDEDIYQSCLRCISMMNNNHSNNDSSSAMSVLQKLAEDETLLSGYGRLLWHALTPLVFQQFIQSLLISSSSAKVVPPSSDSSTTSSSHKLIMDVSRDDNSEDRSNHSDEDSSDENSEFEDDDEDVLTWGELLLHLIPDPDCNVSTTSKKIINQQQRVRFRAPLTAQEWQKLQQEGIWQRYELGQLPLQLPSSTNTKTGNATHTNRTTTNHRVNNSNNNAAGDRDVVSWQQSERQVLMQRLQDHLQHETRLIENVKAYYDRELKLQQLQQQHTQSQLLACQSQVNSLTQRWQDAEAQMAQKQRIQEEKYQLLATEHADLQAQLQRITVTESQQYERLLQEHSQKYTRLEREHQLLQRESSKKDVKLKALERDVVRLQTAQTLSIQELQTVRQTFTEQLQSQRNDQELQRLQAMQEKVQWEEEKAALLQKLASTQEELLAICRNPNNNTTSSNNANSNHTKNDSDDNNVDEPRHPQEVEKVGQPDSTEKYLPSHTVLNNSHHNHGGSAEADQRPAEVQHSRSPADLLVADRHLKHLDTRDHENDKVVTTPAGTGNMQVYGAHLNKLLRLMDNLFDEKSSV